MRKFKTIAAAKDLARMNGWGISVRIWSEADNCWLIKFAIFQPRSQFMAGLI